ncbi:MAG: M23 family metallopeptidase [Flavobacteriaceae bacterium]
MKTKNKKPFKERILNKYRLVILNESSYEERFSYKLSALNIFLLSSLLGLIIVLLTIYLIAFTSVREYIPGYDSSQLRKRALQNIEKVDSLTLVVAKNQEYMNSIGSVISGEVTKEELTKEFEIKKNEILKYEFTIKKEDSLLRKIVEKEDKFNAPDRIKNKVEFFLFSPVSGQITSKYDYGIKHYGIDIALPQKTPIKSVAAGTVVFAEWTVQTGYVVIIEHSFGLISVYKHNDSGLVSQGDPVEAGQVITFSGNTGELTSGPHLHFELWRDGGPIDPEEYISF